ncbi:MAG: ATP-binding cassette domain-containing protein [Proteobacteria bacterium]|jgi:ABC-type lipoprotein export system ATPase subunit|nr:ATP-binding cassette domain-containing protein [Pseudomonadota bacterium]
MKKSSIESIRFEGLQFCFETGEVIFENVDFEFPTKKLIWVQAESGSGRSTLLQILAGLQLPTKGKFLLNDQNVADMSFEEFLPYRLNIGYGFDFGGLIHNRSLLENLTLPLLYHKIESPDVAQEKAQELLLDFGVLKYKDQRPAVVPGGVRKLICLLRAIIHEPEMLLLDDPSVGLSQDTALKYFDRIEQMKKRGKCQHIFVSSFDEKLMGLLQHEEIYVDCGQIYQNVNEKEKKVVNL